MLRKFFSQDEIKRITRNIITLPTLPTVVAKMIELVDNPKTTAATLGKLISSDQVLTAKILKLANSAFYAFPRRIGTVHLAVVVLGFEIVKDLALSVSVIDQFSKGDEEETFDVMRFWEHSIGSGVASRMLAARYGYRVSGEAFTAGLLHDIGKLVLREYLKSEFREVMERVRAEGCSFLEAEQEVLGVTHAEIGGWLVEKWSLPTHLVEAIRTHHQPAEALKNPELAGLTHAADILCRVAGIGSGGDDRVPPMDPQVREILGIPLLDSGESDLEMYRQQLMEEMEKAEIFVNLIQGKEIKERSYAKRA